MRNWRTGWWDLISVISSEWGKEAGAASEQHCAYGTGIVIQLRLLSAANMT